MSTDTSSDYARPAVPLSNGPQMPLLGFGTWQIPDDEAQAATAFALEAGYRHIDTATGYANESGVGKAIAASGLARESVFVTTKMPPDHVGRERATLEQSLEKLGLDRVDLWLVHWPPNKQATPQAWEQFVRAQQDGLATSIGVSNYSIAQIDELTAATKVTPAVNQIKWGPGLFDRSVLDGLTERGVVLEGYSPLRVTSLDDPTLVEIATAHDATTAQVIIAWHVSHGIVVIPKSTHQERIVANAAGVRVELTDAEVARIDGLSTV